MRQFTTVLMTIVVIGTAAMLLRGEAQSSSNLNASTGEVTALEDWAKMAEKTHMQIHALFEAGSAGGEVENEALARYQMCVAKARLAGAKGKRGECAKWFKQAVDAAEKGVEATEAAYDAGTVTLGRLTRVQQQLAEARIHLARELYKSP